MNDPINPDHYKSLTPEPFPVLNSWGVGFGIGNIIKYVLRYHTKGYIVDLKKARQYIDFLIYEAEQRSG